jgi:hypothetical protein
LIFVENSKTAMMGYACNPSTQEAEARESWAIVQPRLHSEFEASLVKKPKPRTGGIAQVIKHLLPSKLETLTLIPSFLPPWKPKIKWNKKN